MLGVMYLHPRSPLRLAIIPIVTLGYFAYRTTVPRFIKNRSVASFPEGPFYLLFLTTVDALVLRRIYLGQDGKEKSERLVSREKNQTKANAQDTSGILSWRAIGWAHRVVFSYRAIGLPKQTPNIPKWSNKDPSYVPSRTSFLARRGIAVVGAFLVIDFLSHQPKPDPEDFSAEKALLFPPAHTLNGATIGTRIFSTVLWWTILRLNIGLFYNLFSWFGVATFLTSPADWPPYFGSVFDSYNLRRFWSVFWHTGLRNPLNSTATFFAYDVFRFPKGSLLGRYTSAYLTFALSGYVHTLMDNTAGIPLATNTAWKLFVMQAIGITVEDFVESTYHRVVGPGNGKSTVLWKKAIGFVWVLGWMAWTTPPWSYQNMRHDADPLYPFSVVERFQASTAKAA
ncbi:hypothetical protein BU23DRAFT_456274 [Bimuria novae-zelandiae CBS 107.79]|uniref:Wax synthase domain-containing protein n=1 Tax=Bimuria novae-zelandiae CBS 107.79 TaxID=1447943 RepID=A0A6A5VHQ9_9PLEO|nr:hypothetical protein BU23DRAFT_456274 [Bimuria novae-zelandiae CBS 107.79]